VGSSSFGVTYDYRCPFARNVHEHLVTALDAGADWNIEFLPFSLTQSHVADGDDPVWGRADKASDLVAIEAGLVVRERFPDRFLDVHGALFTARHDEARDLRDDTVVRDVLKEQGIDGDEVFAAIAEGWPRQIFRQAHEAAVNDHRVFGVPTFISGDASVFVLELLTHPELNEFKHTSVAR
jgi:hypothetical protein